MGKEGVSYEHKASSLLVGNSLSITGPFSPGWAESERLLSAHVLSQAQRRAKPTWLWEAPEVMDF